MTDFDPRVRITTTERLEFFDSLGNFHAVIGADMIDALRKFFAEERTS